MLFSSSKHFCDGKICLFSLEFADAFNLSLLQTAKFVCVSMTYVQQSLTSPFFEVGFFYKTTVSIYRNTKWKIRIGTAGF